MPNIKILEPRVSTHGKAYVYATTNLNFALLFGGNESFGDFDGMYGIENGTPYFYETYEGALKRRFDKAECYIYEVDPQTFCEGKTSFSGEVVSESPVKTLNCEKVYNLYDYLLNLDKEGKIDLHFFENSTEYIADVEDHISDRILRFGVLNNKDGRIYKFCKERFPSILKRLEEEKQNKENCGE